MKCFFLAVGICFGTTELALHVSTLIQRKTKCVQFVFLGPYIVQSSFFYQTRVNCIQNVLYKIQCPVYGTEIYTKQPLITEVKYYNVTRYNSATTMLHFGRLYFQVMSSIKFLSFYLGIIFQTILIFLPNLNREKFLKNSSHSLRSEQLQKDTFGWASQVHVQMFRGFSTLAGLHLKWSAWRSVPNTLTCAEWYNPDMYVEISRHLDMFFFIVVIKQAKGGLLCLMYPGF